MTYFHYSAISVSTNIKAEFKPSVVNKSDLNLMMYSLPSLYGGKILDVWDIKTSELISKERHAFTSSCFKVGMF